MTSGIYLNIEYLKELFNGGASIDDIALTCDVTKFTVRRNLIQLGLIEKQETNRTKRRSAKRVYKDRNEAEEHGLFKANDYEKLVSVEI